MKLPIIFVSLLAAVSAAPQLFIVVPQNFLDLQQPLTSNQERFIPVVIPIPEEGRTAKSLSQDVPVLIKDDSPPTQKEVLTNGISNVTDEEIPSVAPVSEPDVLVEVPVEVVPSEGQVVAAEAIIEEENGKLPVAEEAPVVQNGNEEVPPEEAVAPTIEEIVPDVSEKPVVEQTPEVAVEELIPEPIAEQEAVPEVIPPTDQASSEPSASPAQAEQQPIILPESLTVIQPLETDSVIAEQPSPAPEAPVEDASVQLAQEAVPVEEVPSEPIGAEGGVSTSPKEIFEESADRSGKSLSAGSTSINAIDLSPVAAHFGFRHPSSVVMTQSNTFPHQGATIDPRLLVAPQFRSFIYQNDSPEVIAAKIAFFRVQEGLTPRRP